MDSSAQSGVRVEKEDQAPLAIVIDGDDYGHVLTELLVRQGLRVERKESSGFLLPEAAKYVFLFFSRNRLSSEWKKNLAVATSTAINGQGKMVLILDNVSGSVATEAEAMTAQHGWPVMVVELSGFFDQEQGLIVEAMGKIVRVAFSSKPEQKIVIVGKGGRQISEEREETREQYFPTITENEASPEAHGQQHLENWQDFSLPVAQPKKQHGGSRKKSAGLGVLIAILLLISPVLFVILEVSLGLVHLRSVKGDLASGRYSEAKVTAGEAKENFFLAKNVVGIGAAIGSPIGLGGVLEKGYELLGTAEIGAETLYRLATIQPLVVNLPKGLLSAEEEVDLTAVSQEIILESEAIDRNLGLIEAQWNSGNIKPVSNFSWLVGIPKDKFESYFAKIGSYRRMLRNGKAALTVLPDLVGVSGKRTYLVVFQNSAELRATGGFIGSYAIVHFDDGKLLDYKINDIYTADGQLKGRVTPPDEILHYLGQPNWYMRDANFAPDFALTAKRLEWFLEKETGQVVDGVVAVNLGAVQQFLEATGGVSVEGEKELITAENFFHKAEYAAEINFFPGSTQKKDFLGAVADRLLEKMTGEENSRNWLALGQGIQTALDQKDLLFYFNSTSVQQMIEGNGWSGGIRSGECFSAQNDCIMVVESNFGANKSNFFIKESMEIESTIDKGGQAHVQMKLNMRNESPSESWPGGRYKNYIRFLMPLGTRFSKMDLGDSRVATVSTVLTQQVMAKVQRNQFLVFNTVEAGTVGTVATTSAYTSFGTLVEVPAGGNRVVTLEALLPKRMDFKSEESIYRLNLIKQPGNSIDAVSLTLNYPSFLAVVGSEGGEEMDRAIASEQKLSYNMDLLTDRQIKVRFKRQ